MNYSIFRNYSIGKNCILVKTTKLVYIEFNVRPCKLNNLFLIPVRANFLPPSGYILCFVIEYLILVNNPRRINIVVIVF